MIIDELIPDNSERRILQLQRERDQTRAVVAVWAYAAARIHGLLLESTADDALLQRAQAIIQQISTPDAPQQLLAVVEAAERLVQQAPHLPAVAVYHSNVWQELVERVQRWRGEQLPGTTYVNAHRDDVRCVGCDKSHAPLNDAGRCLGCALKERSL